MQLRKEVFNMMENKEEQQNQLDNKTPNQVDKVVESNTSIAVNNNDSLNSLNLFDEKQLASAEVFLNKIIKSSKGGITSVNDGLAILMRAKDLGLPFSSCLEHIHVINGKTGVDIHIIKALLLKAGCRWECLKDYQPLYEYTDSINVYVDGKLPSYAIRCISAKEAEIKAKADIEKGIDDNVYVYPVKWYKDFNGNLYKDYQLDSRKFSIAINRQAAAELMKAGKIPVYRVPNEPIDYVTEYKIFRYINGKETSAIGHFSYSEAIAADMFEKDTYKKYPRILIGHRAFTYAARDIASDILSGVMETTEIKIVNNKDLSNEDYISVEDME